LDARRSRASLQHQHHNDSPTIVLTDNIAFDVYYGYSKPAGSITDHKMIDGSDTCDGIPPTSAPPGPDSPTIAPAEVIYYKVKYRYSKPAEGPVPPTECDTSRAMASPSKISTSHPRNQRRQHDSCASQLLSRMNIPSQQASITDQRIIVDLCNGITR